MATDVFRPRLPIDPFNDVQPPWIYVQAELHAVQDPLHGEPHDAEPHTILVLGAPTHADLAPLALSPNLASSLLLIATHTPPPVPEAAQCPIVILRLPAPLDIHDAGAVRLVSLLDRAQRVAHAWHVAPYAQPRIQQLAELYPGGEFSIAELPVSTVAAPEPPRPDPSETSSLASSTSSRSSFAHKTIAPPKGQFTFSALINFLPSTLPDKALLKHAILVTTLSAPFLAAQPLPLSLSLSADAPRRRSRFVSLFSRKQPPSSFTPPSLSSSRAPSAESLFPALPRHAHIVHVIPYHRRLSSPTKSKLAQTIEQFLLSFAYPPSASASAPSLASLSVLSTTPPTHRAAPARSSPLASPASSLRTVHSTSTTNARRPSPLPTTTNMAPNTPAIPYLVPAGLLGACPVGSRRCVGEMVLCGVLDSVASGCAGEGGGWPRAWIGGTDEVVVVVAQSATASAGVPVSASPIDSRVASASTDGGGDGNSIDRPVKEGHGDGDVIIHASRTEKDDRAVDNEQHPTKPKSKRQRKRKRTRARRNEAGLPTPPESSSSAEWGSDNDDDDHDHDHDHDDQDSASASDSDSGHGDERAGTEDTHASHASAPVLGTKTREFLAVRGPGPGPGTQNAIGRDEDEDEDGDAGVGKKNKKKALSEAHFGVRVCDVGVGWNGKAKGKEKEKEKGGKRKLGERVVRFWDGLRLGRLVRVRGVTAVVVAERGDVRA